MDTESASVMSALGNNSISPVREHAGIGNSSCHHVIFWVGRSVGACQSWPCVLLITKSRVRRRENEPVPGRLRVTHVPICWGDPVGALFQRRLRASARDLLRRSFAVISIDAKFSRLSAVLDAEPGFQYERCWQKLDFTSARARQYWQSILPPSHLLGWPSSRCIAVLVTRDACSQ